MKILIAVDGSSSALRAVKYAATLAKQLAEKPHITLVTVHDDTGLRHLAKHLPKDGLQDYFREISDRDLKPARKLLDKADLPHDMVIKIGHVVEEIMNTANTGKFDTLVLGSKGRSGFGDLVLGSVAQRLCALAKQHAIGVDEPNLAVGVDAPQDLAALRVVDAVDGQCAGAGLHKVDGFSFADVEALPAQ